MTAANWVDYAELRNEVVKFHNRRSTLAEVAILIEVDIDRTLSELVHVIAGAATRAGQLPEEKRIAHVREFMKALGLIPADPGGQP